MEFFLIWFLTATGVSNHDLRGLGHLANLAHRRLLESPTSQPFKVDLRFLSNSSNRLKSGDGHSGPIEKTINGAHRDQGQTTRQIHHSEDSGLSKAVKYSPTINGERATKPRPRSDPSLSLLPNTHPPSPPPTTSLTPRALQ